MEIKFVTMKIEESLFVLNSISFFILATTMTSHLLISEYPIRQLTTGLKSHTSKGYQGVLV